MDKNYESLLAYKILQEWGDKEIVNKSNALLESYKKAQGTAEAEYWNYRETEFDDEHPDKFLKAIWSYNGPDYFMQLEILTDFSLSHPLYKHALKDAQTEAVKYFEQKEKGYSFNPETNVVYVVKVEDENHPAIVSKKGTIFSGLKETHRSIYVPQPEESQESI